VPVLNEVDYIRQAMESLMAQDYRPLEIVVYDAGSTDGTLEILREYPVEVIVEKGLGQMAAINRGWMKSSAELVMWFAGDDLLNPGGIRRLAEELHAHPEVGFVHGDMDVINKSGELVSTIRPGDVELEDIVAQFKIMPQSTIIRRSVLRASGMMDEKRRLAADWDLFLRILQYSPGLYVPFTAATRRIHDGSEDVLNPSAQADAVLDVLNKFFERTDLTENQRKLKNKGIASSQIMAALLQNTARNRSKAIELLRAALKIHPFMVFRTRAGRHLLISLLLGSAVDTARLRRVQRSIERLFAAI
jgi:glycosyltransferase involved in cell wall biosynthesis